MSLLKKLRDLLTRFKEDLVTGQKNRGSERKAWEPKLPSCLELALSRTRDKHQNDAGEFYENESLEGAGIS